MNAALKEINETEEDAIENACYEENDDFVVFTAGILDPVYVNGKVLDENATVSALDTIDTDYVKVKCSLVCENYDGIDFIGLKLEEIEWNK